MVILLLILAAFIFIETPLGQNWLAKQITKKFSRELKTKISIRHVSFSLLNKLNIEDFLLEDQQHDTLLYAGNLQVRITDWFIFKDTAELKYVGLENSLIKLNRNDTSWNYQFLVNYFTPTSKTPKKQSGIEFNLKKLGLKNVVLIEKDAWQGQDMTATIGSLQMDANEISVDKKNIDINSLYLVQPLLRLYSYTGKGNPGQKKDTVVTDSPSVIDSLLEWNQAGWTMNITSLKIDNGSFKTIKQDNKPALSYFDSKDIEFTAIDAQLTYGGNR